MSAPNFNLMKEFDLYVLGNKDVCDMFIGIGSEDADGNIIEEYTDADVEFAWYLFNDCDEYCIQNSIDELNDELKWYHVELKDGCYSGIQIYIDTEWVNIGEWSEEDCIDEFDLTKKETMYMILDEQKKIAKWLEDDATQYGFKRLICDGIFSNGEAVYHYA